MIAGGKPQEVECVVKPGTELKISKPTAMHDLMAYLYNPAIEADCDY